MIRIIQSLSKTRSVWTKTIYIKWTTVLLCTQWLIILVNLVRWLETNLSRNKGLFIVSRRIDNKRKRLPVESRPRWSLLIIQENQPSDARLKRANCLLSRTMSKVQRWTRISNHLNLKLQQSIFNNQTLVLVFLMMKAQPYLPQVTSYLQSNENDLILIPSLLMFTRSNSRVLIRRISRSINQHSQPSS